MKSKLIIGLSVLLLSSCSSSNWLDSSYYEDDIYYNPSSKPISVSDDYAPSKQSYSNADERYPSSYTQPNNSVSKDSRDFSQVQQHYAAESKDSLNSIDNSGEYAQRLAKYHDYNLPYEYSNYNDEVHYNDYDIYMDNYNPYSYNGWYDPWYSSYYAPYNYHHRPWNWSLSMGYGYGGWNSYNFV